MTEIIFDLQRDRWGKRPPCRSRVPSIRVAAQVPSKSPFRSATRQNRHGFTIVEMIGTCALLGVLFSITVPMFVIIARERHSTEQRQFALQHVTNLLEGALARQWSELQPGDLAVPQADADLQAVLPGLERALVVNQVDGSPESRRISASIRWQNGSGQFVAPIQISGWIYPSKEVP